MSNRVALAAAFLVPWIAACGSATVSPATHETPIPSTIATTGPTSIASPTAVATASAGACPAAGVIPKGSLPQCPYTIPFAGLTANFTIADPGWLGKRQADGPELSRQAPFGIFTLTTFGGRVYTDPCTGIKATTIDTSPKSLIDFVAATKQLVAGKPVAATFAGVDALQLDVTADGIPACSDWIALWAVAGGAVFGLTPGNPPDSSPP